MHKQTSFLRLITFVRPLVRLTAAMAALAGCVPLAAFAQQAVAAPDNAAATSPLYALVDTKPLDLDLAHTAGITYSSSSPAIETINLTGPDRLDLAGVSSDATQPPPRRRYGRPRYNDNSHNPDGSSKYAFIAGAGLTLPNGNTYHYLNTDYSFQVGAGRNFNKNLSLLVQFDWDNFGFNGGTLTNQTNLYNFYCPITSQIQQLCTLISGLDGKSHVWSFSLNPVYNIYNRQGVGAYVVAGVGFYHKTANFTVPGVGYYYDPYYNQYIPYAANQTIDKYTSNAPGFSGGIGLTYKLSRFSTQRLYVEARYVFVDNSQRSGVFIGNSAATLNAYNGNNFYPANSNRTTYVPIKAGIRF